MFYKYSFSQTQRKKKSSLLLRSNIKDRFYSPKSASDYIYRRSKYKYDKSYKNESTNAVHYSRFFQNSGGLIKNQKIFHKILPFIFGLQRSPINSLFFSIALKKSWVFLKSFLRFVLWALPVPKHKFIFMWMRFFFKNLIQVGYLKNVLVKVKGKIAVTGNKRTRPFYIKYGSFHSTDTYIINSFVVRTPTGLLNVLVRGSFI